jgi:hypothetical protein
VIKVASVVFGYEDKGRNNWYNEECEIKVDKKNTAKIKILNKTTRMNTKNYKTN